MDKNTWIGFGLIALIIVGSFVFEGRNSKQLKNRQEATATDTISKIDSLATQNVQQLQSPTTTVIVQADNKQAGDKIEEKETVAQNIFDAFAPAGAGEETYVVLENDLVRLTFASHSGRLWKAELKNYKTYGDTVNYLSLFKGRESSMSFIFKTRKNHNINTADMYFQPQPVVELEDGSKRLVMRLLTDTVAYLDFVYTLPKDDYMLNFSIVGNELSAVIPQNVNFLDFSWSQLIPQQERGRKFEERYATLQYMLKGGDIDNLSESKLERENVTGRVKWVAYKDQFFSTVLIADNELSGVRLFSKPMDKNSGYIKVYQTVGSVAFDPMGRSTTDMRLYLGPNHYNTLKAYDEGLSKDERLKLKTLVPLGWKIVSWINMWLVIPMFDLFTSWGMHIGWVILLMTLVIKLIILPFTFQSYRSSAKMRVLKPQVDAINEKYPPEKMLERQQATTALYNKAGASPMSGCLPMLLQMPVVMAMFWFFPTAIELRGQSFLWAEDLSTYDAVISWNTYIPLVSWALNNHISLFCLLMTVTNIVYTYLNMQTQATGNDPSAKVMRWMMYLMPLMFFFIFNDYAAGLSYYYFVSLLMTIVQTYIFRWSIDDEKLLKQMEERAKKNNGKPKKSGFMARIEKMQREQQQYMREQAKQRAKR